MVKVSGLPRAEVGRGAGDPGLVVEMGYAIPRPNPDGPHAVGGDGGHVVVSNGGVGVLVRMGGSRWCSSRQV
jgi:hypothetical protein